MKGSKGTMMKGGMKPKGMDDMVKSMPAHAMPKKGGKKGKATKKRGR